MGEIRKMIMQKLKRCLVTVLAITTIASSLPVYAEDVTTNESVGVIGNQTSDIDLNNNNQEEIENETDVEIGENDSDSSYSDTGEKNAEISIQNQEETEDSNSIEQRLNYLYIENPYVETPATQRIVVSWGDGTEAIEAIDLSVEHNGDIQTWTSQKAEDGTFLYERAFEDGQDGIYTVKKLVVKTADKETEYFLSDLGMEAVFGVNEMYEGISELQLMDGQQAADEIADDDQFDIAVMSIDEDGSITEESSIEDALENAGAEEEQSEMQTYAADNSRAVDKSIVVALDPGHDSIHTGAGANGVREEVLTLKIAQYCKAELEKYANVSVYMTRTTADCPYPKNKNSGGDISDRVYAAAKAGASIFVSFHLNSSTSTAAKGAEVIVPNNSWRPQVAQQGRELANDIINELTAIGLQKRSIYSKDTTLTSEKYPDGSKSDYFSVQIAAKENNIPGIIIEHAFLTNSSDVNTYLNNEAGLKKLGIADATGIAKYLGLSKGVWVQDSKGWKYKENGKYIKNTWKNITGNKYYFDSNGYRVTGWQTIAGQKYFFMPEGYMMTGWISFGDTRYYLMPDGHMLTGWCTFGSTRYYLASDGKMVRGWQTISGKKYFFMPEGYMMRGWISFGSTRYYLDTNGVMQIGWQTIDGKKYFFLSDGKMAREWVSFGSNQYYLDTNGVMQTGWQTIDGKKYFFMPEGYMMQGWISFGSTRYYLDANGVMQTGWQTIDGKKYFFMPEGYMMRGWISFGKIRYYLDSNGVMVTGKQKIDGNTYIFADDGQFISESISGWKTVNGKTYYYNSSGIMQTGWQTIDEKKYFFMPDGHMMTGWISFGDIRYYLMPDGHMLTGWCSFGSTRYYLASDGKMVRGWRTIDGKKYFFMPDGHMMTGWISFGDIRYYLMPDGHMLTGWCSFGSTRYYLASDGKMVRGWQTIDGKKYFFMPEGYMMRGWISFGSIRYYLDANGVVQTGTQLIDGKTYQFADDGKLISEIMSGWKTINGKTYYYNSSGVMQTGWQTIDGKKYFFMPEGYMMTGWISFGQTRYYLMPDGHMLTGWCSFGSIKYYLASDGKMVRGWQTIGGKKYYFNTDGIMQTGWQTIDGKKYFFMPEGYMMTGWISFGKTRYYLDKSGVMQKGWQFISNIWYYFRTDGTLDDSCTTDQLMAISGKTTVTTSQMEKYFKAKGATYPEYYSKTDAPTLEKFCQIYVEEANAEGINGAIAFTQAMKETAWLKFGGDVKIEQNNFAGIGTTGGGVAGASFTTVREGIRAQIQHLKAYGSKDALKNGCVDPRFSLVTRGSASYVEWLGQKENPNGYGWATSEGYGIDIVKMVKGLQKY